MEIDWQKIAESKKAYRKKLASLPIAEKLRILEQLSERAAMIQRSQPCREDAAHRPGGTKEISRGLSEAMPPEPRTTPKSTPAGVQEAPAIDHISDTPLGCDHVGDEIPGVVASLDPRLISRNPARLPDGWRWATVGELSTQLEYGSSEKTSEDSSGVPVLRMGNIVNGSLNLQTLKYLPTNHDEFPALLLQPGDLLFNRTNSAELVDKCAVYHGNPHPCSFASYLIRVRVNDQYSPDLLGYYLTSQHGRAWVKSVVSQQVGQANVNGTKLRALRVPVPPLDEQQRIVAEIEKQFTRLEAGVASLKRVQAALKRYRASVLKAACEGRLVPTEAGWTETTIRDAVEIIDYRGRTPPFSESGIPHLRSQNIRYGRVVWSDLAHVTKESYDAFMTRGLPRDGDLLFTTEAPMGEVALAPTEKFSVAQRIMILRANTEILQSRFLMVQLRSPQFQARLRRSGTGSTVTGVSSRNFQPLTLLVPPIGEQERIVADVERRLSVIEELEAAVTANLQRATRLRHSILSSAFATTA